jgi:hypothetical protein
MHVAVGLYRRLNPTSPNQRQSRLDSCTLRNPFAKKSRFVPQASMYGALPIDMLALIRTIDQAQGACHTRVGVWVWCEGLMVVVKASSIGWYIDCIL